MLPSDLAPSANQVVLALRAIPGRRATYAGLALVLGIGDRAVRIAAAKAVAAGVATGVVEGQRVVMELTPEGEAVHDQLFEGSDDEESGSETPEACDP